MFDSVALAVVQAAASAYTSRRASTPSPLDPPNPAFIARLRAASTWTCAYCGGRRAAETHTCSGCGAARR